MLLRQFSSGLGIKSFLFCSLAKITVLALFLSQYFRTIIFSERPILYRYVSSIGLGCNRPYTLSTSVPQARGKAFMETQSSIMAKTPSTTGTATSKPKTAERRGSRRCKITQLMRIRPSDPEKDHFDDMRGTLSVSRSGVYFQTSEVGYEIGMRLFVTLPFSQ